MTKLLPCPFCGSNEIEIVHCDEGCCGALPRLVECKCGVELGGRWGDDEQAARAWNTRVVDGHVVTFYWDEPGVVGPNGTWCAIKDCWMYGPCDTWQEVEEDIRTGWEHDRNLVG